jgi:hypothetical protein
MEDRHKGCLKHPDMAGTGITESRMSAVRIRGAFGRHYIAFDTLAASQYHFQGRSAFGNGSMCHSPQAIDVRRLLSDIEPFDLPQLYGLLNHTSFYTRGTPDRAFIEAVVCGRIYIYQVDAPDKIQSIASSSEIAGASEALVSSDIVASETQNLHQALRQQLNQVVRQELAETRNMTAVFNDLNGLERGLVRTGALFTGVAKAIKDLADQVSNIVALGPNATSMRALIIAYKVLDRPVDWELRIDMFTREFQAAQREALVAALGFDPRDISKEAIQQALELTEAILSDRASRTLLEHFAKEYVSAQHELEWYEMGGGFLFGFILSAILAALTAGAGLALSAARLGNQLKIGKLLQKLGQHLHKHRPAKKKRHTKNLEVQVKVESKPAPKPNPENEPKSAKDKLEKAEKRGDDKKAEQAGDASTMPGGGVVPDSKLIAERQQVAESFYKEVGYNDKRVADHMRGIDFSQPVDVVTIPKGTEAIQYQIPGAPLGNYFALPGTPGNKLGFYTSGREATSYVSTQDIPVLRSFASSTIDDWSMKDYGWEIEAPGGATQFFDRSKAWEKK